VDKKIDKLAAALLLSIHLARAVPGEPTTAVIQHYLDVLPGDPAAEPIIRELPERAADRSRLCVPRPALGLPAVGACP
jgi:hypothetical protein